MNAGEPGRVLSPPTADQASEGRNGARDRHGHVGPGAGAGQAGAVGDQAVGKDGHQPRDQHHDAAAPREPGVELAHSSARDSLHLLATEPASQQKGEHGAEGRAGQAEREA